MSIWMCVDLCGGQFLVAKKHLNFPDVGVLQQFCGVGVAQGVWHDALVEDLETDPANELLDAVY